MPARAAVYFVVAEAVSNVIRRTAVRSAIFGKDGPPRRPLICFNRDQFSMIGVQVG